MENLEQLKQNVINSTNKEELKKNLFKIIDTIEPSDMERTLGGPKSKDLHDFLLKYKNELREMKNSLL